MPDSQAPAGAAEQPFPRSPTNQYRKQPVVIHAVQFGLAEYADEPGDEWRFDGEMPEWLADAVLVGRVTYRFESEDYWYFVVQTLEGDMRGGPDDWLILGVEGELYPCADRIFRATYLAVE